MPFTLTKWLNFFSGQDYIVGEEATIAPNSLTRQLSAENLITPTGNQTWHNANGYDWEELGQWQITGANPAQQVSVTPNISIKLNNTTLTAAQFESQYGIKVVLANIGFLAGSNPKKDYRLLVKSNDLDDISALIKGKESLTFNVSFDTTQNGATQTLNSSLIINGFNYAPEVVNLNGFGGDDEIENPIAGQFIEADVAESELNGLVNNETPVFSFVYKDTDTTPNINRIDSVTVSGTLDTNNDINNNTFIWDKDEPENGHYYLEYDSVQNKFFIKLTQQGANLIKSKLDIGEERTISFNVKVKDTGNVDGTTVKYDTQEFKLKLLGQFAAPQVKAVNPEDPSVYTNSLIFSERDVNDITDLSKQIGNPYTGGQLKTIAMFELIDNDFSSNPNFDLLVDSVLSEAVGSNSFALTKDVHYTVSTPTLINGKRYIKFNLTEAGEKFIKTEVKENEANNKFNLKLKVIDPVSNEVSNEAVTTVTIDRIADSATKFNGVVTTVGSTQTFKEGDLVISNPGGFFSFFTLGNVKVTDADKMDSADILSTITVVNGAGINLVAGDYVAWPAFYLSDYYREANMGFYLTQQGIDKIKPNLDDNETITLQGKITVTDYNGSTKTYTQNFDIKGDSLPAVTLESAPNLPLDYGTDNDAGTADLFIDESSSSYYPGAVLTKIKVADIGQDAYDLDIYCEEDLSMEQGSGPNDGDYYLKLTSGTSWPKVYELILNQAGYNKILNYLNDGNPELQLEFHTIATETGAGNGVAGGESNESIFKITIADVDSPIKLEVYNSTNSDNGFVDGTDVIISNNSTTTTIDEDDLGEFVASIKFYDVDSGLPLTKLAVEALTVNGSIALEENVDFEKVLITTGSNEQLYELRFTGDGEEKIKNLVTLNNDGKVTFQTTLETVSPPATIATHTFTININGINDAPEIQDEIPTPAIPSFDLSVLNPAPTTPLLAKFSFSDVDGNFSLPGLQSGQTTSGIEAYSSNNNDAIVKLEASVDGVSIIFSNLTTANDSYKDYFTLNVVKVAGSDDEYTYEVKFKDNNAYNDFVAKELGGANFTGEKILKIKLKAYDDAGLISSELVKEIKFTNGAPKIDPYQTTVTTDSSGVTSGVITINESTFPTSGEVTLAQFKVTDTNLDTANGMLPPLYTITAKDENGDDIAFDSTHYKVETIAGANSNEKIVIFKLTDDGRIYVDKQLNKNGSTIEKLKFVVAVKGVDDSSPTPVEATKIYYIEILGANDAPVVVDDSAQNVYNIDQISENSLISSHDGTEILDLSITDYDSNLNSILVNPSANGQNLERINIVMKVGNVDVTSYFDLYISSAVNNPINPFIKPDYYDFDVRFKKGLKDLFKTNFVNATGSAEVKIDINVKDNTTDGTGLVTLPTKTITFTNVAVVPPHFENVQAAAGATIENVNQDVTESTIMYDETDLGAGFQNTWFSIDIKDDVAVDLFNNSFDWNNDNVQFNSSVLDGKIVFSYTNNGQPAILELEQFEHFSYQASGLLGGGQTVKFYLTGNGEQLLKNTLDDNELATGNFTIHYKDQQGNVISHEFTLKIDGYSVVAVPPRFENVQAAAGATVENVNQDVTESTIRYDEADITGSANTWFSIDIRDADAAVNINPGSTFDANNDGILFNTNFGGKIVFNYTNSNGQPATMELNGNHFGYSWGPFFGGGDDIRINFDLTTSGKQLIENTLGAGQLATGNFTIHYKDQQGNVISHEFTLKIDGYSTANATPVFIADPNPQPLDQNIDPFIFTYNENDLNNSSFRLFSVTAQDDTSIGLINGMPIDLTFIYPGGTKTISLIQGVDYYYSSETTINSGLNTGTYAFYTSNNKIYNELKDLISAGQTATAEFTVNYTDPQGNAATPQLIKINIIGNNPSGNPAIITGNFDPIVKDVDLVTDWQNQSQHTLGSPWTISQGTYEGFEIIYKNKTDSSDTHLTTVNTALTQQLIDKYFQVTNNNNQITLSLRNLNAGPGLIELKDILDVNDAYKFTFRLKAKGTDGVIKIQNIDFDLKGSINSIQVNEGTIADAIIDPGIIYEQFNYNQSFSDEIIKGYDDEFNEDDEKPTISPSSISFVIKKFTPANPNGVDVLANNITSSEYTFDPATGEFTLDAGALPQIPAGEYYLLQVNYTAVSPVDGDSKDGSFVLRVDGVGSGTGGDVNIIYPATDFIEDDNIAQNMPVAFLNVTPPQGQGLLSYFVTIDGPTSITGNSGITANFNQMFSFDTATGTVAIKANAVTILKNEITLDEEMTVTVPIKVAITTTSGNVVYVNDTITFTIYDNGGANKPREEGDGSEEVGKMMAASVAMLELEWIGGTPATNFYEEYLTNPGTDYLVGKFTIKDGGTVINDDLVLSNGSIDTSALNLSVSGMSGVNNNDFIISPHTTIINGFPSVDYFELKIKQTSLSKFDVTTAQQLNVVINVQDDSGNTLTFDDYNPTFNDELPPSNNSPVILTDVGGNFLNETGSTPIVSGETLIEFSLDDLGNNHLYVTGDINNVKMQVKDSAGNFNDVSLPGSWYSLNSLGNGRFGIKITSQAAIDILKALPPLPADAQNPNPYNLFKFVVTAKDYDNTGTLTGTQDVDTGNTQFFKLVDNTPVNTNQAVDIVDSSVAFSVTQDGDLNVGDTILEFNTSNSSGAVITSANIAEVKFTVNGTEYVATATGGTSSGLKFEVNSSGQVKVTVMNNSNGTAFVDAVKNYINATNTTIPVYIKVTDPEAPTDNTKDDEYTGVWNITQAPSSGSLPTIILAGQNDGVNTATISENALSTTANTKLGKIYVNDAEGFATDTSGLPIGISANISYNANGTNVTALLNPTHYKVDGIFADSGGYYYEAVLTAQGAAYLKPLLNTSQSMSIKVDITATDNDTPTNHTVSESFTFTIEGDGSSNSATVITQDTSYDLDYLETDSAIVKDGGIVAKYNISDADGIASIVIKPGSTSLTGLVLPGGTPASLGLSDLFEPVVNITNGTFELKIKGAGSNAADAIKQFTPATGEANGSFTILVTDVNGNTSEQVVNFKIRGDSNPPLLINQTPASLSYTEVATTTKLDSDDSVAKFNIEDFDDISATHFYNTADFVVTLSKKNASGTYDQVTLPTGSYTIERDLTVGTANQYNIKLTSAFITTLYGTVNPNTTQEFQFKVKVKDFDDSTKLSNEITTDWKLIDDNPIGNAPVIDDLTPSNQTFTEVLGTTKLDGGLTGDILAKFAVTDQDNPGNTINYQPADFTVELIDADTDSVISFVNVTANPFIVLPVANTGGSASNPKQYTIRLSQDAVNYLKTLTPAGDELNLKFKVLVKDIAIPSTNLISDPIETATWKFVDDTPQSGWVSVLDINDEINLQQVLANPANFLGSMQVFDFATLKYDIPGAGNPVPLINPVTKITITDGNTTIPVNLNNNTSVLSYNSTPVDGATEATFRFTKAALTGIYQAMVSQPGANWTELNIELNLYIGPKTAPIATDTYNLKVKLFENAAAVDIYGNLTQDANDDPINQPPVVPPVNPPAPPPPAVHNYADLNDNDGWSFADENLADNLELVAATQMTDNGVFNVLKTGNVATDLAVVKIPNVGDISAVTIPSTIAIKNAAGAAIGGLVKGTHYTFTTDGSTATLTLTKTGADFVAAKLAGTTIATATVALTLTDDSGVAHTGNYTFKLSNINIETHDAGTTLPGIDITAAQEDILFDTTGGSVSVETFESGDMTTVSDYSFGNYDAVTDTFHF